MPELPEVETIKLQLTKYIIGKEISNITSLHKKSLIGNPKLVYGKKVTGVKRYGKMLAIELSGDYLIAVHLKMTGQLVFVHGSEFVVQGKKKKDEIDSKYKHIRVVIEFKAGEKLLFNDQRIFGWVRIMKNEELGSMNYVEKLGPEPWDVSDEDLFNKVRTKNRAIKLVIMDQEIISGVGNIYANDALWEARILPEKKAKALSQEEVGTLRKSIVKVLKEGINYRGSTGKDEGYIDLEGNKGEYQYHFRVYEQDGLKCKRGDGGVIKKIKLGGRGTYFCPVCQK